MVRKITKSSLVVYIMIILSIFIGVALLNIDIVKAEGQCLVKTVSIGNNQHKIYIEENIKKQTLTKESIFEDLHKATSKLNLSSDTELLKKYASLLLESDYVIFSHTNYRIATDEKGISAVITDDELTGALNVQKNRSNPWESNNNYIRITTTYARQSALDRDGRKAIKITAVVEWLKYFSTWNRHDYIGIGWSSSGLDDTDTMAPYGSIDTRVENYSASGKDMSYTITNNAGYTSKDSGVAYKYYVKAKGAGSWKSTVLNANCLLQVNDDINVRTTFCHDQGLFPASDKLNSVSFSGVTFNIADMKKYEADSIYIEHKTL